VFDFELGASSNARIGNRRRPAEKEDANTGTPPPSSSSPAAAGSNRVALVERPLLALVRAPVYESDKFSDGTYYRPCSPSFTLGPILGNDPSSCSHDRPGPTPNSVAGARPPDPAARTWWVPSRGRPEFGSRSPKPGPLRGRPPEHSSPPHNVPSTPGPAAKRPSPLCLRELEPLLGTATAAPRPLLGRRTFASRAPESPLRPPPSGGCELLCHVGAQITGPPNHESSRFFPVVLPPPPSVPNSPIRKFQHRPILRKKNARITRTARWPPRLSTPRERTSFSPVVVQTPQSRHQGFFAPSTFGNIFPRATVQTRWSKKSLGHAPSPSEPRVRHVERPRRKWTSLRQQEESRRQRLGGLAARSVRAPPTALHEFPATLIQREEDSGANP